MKKDLPLILLVLFTLVLVLASGLLVYVQSHANPAVVPVSTTVASTSWPQLIPQRDDLQSSVGIIATSTKVLNSYTSKEYGIFFLFPSKGWYIGGNCLGCGTFQVSNYDPETADGKDFTFATATKIEMGISRSNTYGTSTDYPEVERHEKTVIVAGREVRGFDIELLQGKVRSYSIPLPKKPGLFLNMSAYGNTESFYILDEIARSLEFHNELPTQPK